MLAQRLKPGISSAANVVKDLASPVNLLSVGTAQVTGALWHLSLALCLVFAGELHASLCAPRAASGHGDGSEQLRAGLMHCFLFPIAMCCLGEVNLEQFETAVKYPRMSRSFWRTGACTALPVHGVGKAPRERIASVSAGSPRPACPWGSLWMFRARTGCPGRGDSSLRCPHQWKEGIEPVCFSSPEETGGGDTTCRCGSHAAATCMWAAGARVRLCLLCCLSVRGAGHTPLPSGLAGRDGSGDYLCVCVCVCPLRCVPRVRCRGVGVRWGVSSARAWV